MNVNYGAQLMLFQNYIHRMVHSRPFIDAHLTNDQYYFGTLLLNEFYREKNENIENSTLNVACSIMNRCSKNQNYLIK